MKKSPNPSNQNISTPELDKKDISFWIIPKENLISSRLDIFFNSRMA